MATRKFVPLFYLQKQVLILNVDELSLVPEYKEVMRGHTKTDDNSYIYKVWSFIWLFSCFDSPHINLPDQERFEEAVRDSQLGKTFYPDAAIWEAVARFQEFERVRFPELEVLVALKRGLLVTKKTIEMLTDEITDINDDIQKNLALLRQQKSEPNNQEQVTVIKVNIDADKVRLLTTQSQLQTLQKSVPEGISKIEALTKKLKAEYSEQQEVRGGGFVGNREDA